MIKEALRIHALGLIVIPTGINKRPTCKWKQYQNKQLKSDILEIFSESTESMALVTGNGIEVIDIDSKYFLEHHREEMVFDLILAAVGEETYKQLVINRTVSGGYHVIYKTNVSEGNQKLASRYTIDEERKNDHDKIRVLLETRGEGGYILIPPSKGYTYDSNIQLDRIPTLTDYQRNSLIAACRSFDELDETYTQSKATIPVKVTGSGKSTIEAFNESHTPLELMEAAGWQRGYNGGGNLHLVRPGKTIREGIGAGYSEKLNLVRIFTSSTQFEPDKTYNAFQVYAVLNHGGNYSEACKELYHAGFGERMGKVTESHRDKVSQLVSSDPNVSGLASNTDLMEQIYNKQRLDITVKPNRKPNTLFLYCEETQAYRGLGGDGDLVNVFGREKTRKSAVAACAASCFLVDSQTEHKSLNFMADFNGRDLLHFDTEQSEYYHHNLASQMLHQQGLNTITHPKNFFSFSIMPYTKLDRLNFIRYTIEKHKNIGCVFVDGIVDLCRNYNDLEESSDLVTFFMNMASSRKFLLLDVLHNARSTGDARGHLGTELLNKATCNINITKEEDSNASTLKIKNMRGQEPKGFDFWHNSQGNIEIC